MRIPATSTSKFVRTTSLKIRRNGCGNEHDDMSKKKIAFLSVSVALLLSLLGGALFGQAATQKNNVYRYLSIFTEVYDLVSHNYVEQVPPDQLLDGAFSGVTDA